MPYDNDKIRFDEADMQLLKWSLCLWVFFYYLTEKHLWHGFKDWVQNKMADMLQTTFSDAFLLK